MPYRAECVACSLCQVVADAESALDLHEAHVSAHGSEHFVEFERIREGAAHANGAE